MDEARLLTSKVVYDGRVVKLQLEYAPRGATVCNAFQTNGTLITDELAAFLKQIKLDTATQARILLTSRRDESDWLGGIPHRIARVAWKNA